MHELQAATARVLLGVDTEQAGKVVDIVQPELANPELTAGTQMKVQRRGRGDERIDREPVDFKIQGVIECRMDVAVEDFALNKGGIQCHQACLEEHRITSCHPLHGGFGQPQADGVGCGLQGKGSPQGLVEVGVAAEGGQLQARFPMVELLPLPFVASQAAAGFGGQRQLLHPGTAAAQAGGVAGHGFGAQLQVQIQPGGQGQHRRQRRPERRWRQR